MRAAGAGEGVAAAAFDGAVRIGEELLRRAVDEDGGITWRCPDAPMRVGDPVEWRPQEALYDGTAGIALFLAELAAATGEVRLRAAVDGAVRWLLRRCDRTDAPAPGFYTGRIGTCWVLARWAAITGDAALRTRALELARPVADGLVTPGSHDLLAGTAGSALGLVGLCRSAGTPPPAAALAAYLVALAGSASAGPAGLCWDRSELAAHGLCGIAHGAAGVGLAALDAGRAIGAAAGAWLARQAFLYEEARDAEAGLGMWPDLRRDDVFLDLDRHLATAGAEPPALTAPRSMVGWCNGAVGIGLVRLYAFRRSGAERDRRQAERALAIVSRHLRSPSSSLLDLTLCHGLCGFGELFLAAAEVLGDPAHRAAADGVAEDLLRREETVPGSWFRAAAREPLAGDPSLFLGAAGIGHFLLRVVGRGEVPSVALPTWGAAADGGPPPGAAAEPTVATCRREVLRATFPRLVSRLEEEDGEAFVARLAASGGDDLEAGWERGFLSWAASRPLPDGARTVALAARVRELDLAVDNDALLAFRGLRRRRRAAGLAALGDRRLLALRLRVAPRLAVWDGDGTEPRILEPRPDGVRVLPLPPLCREVLRGYGVTGTGSEVAAAIAEEHEIAAPQRAELARRVAEQVRALLRRGLLEEEAVG